MIGITLSSDQIRAAPPEVRRWIERQLATSLGLQIAGPDGQGAIDQLAICSVEELGAMLTLIQGVFPAVNVLFELDREGVTVAQGRLQAYRLIDILHHVRLQAVDQVVSCLNLINEALCRVRGTADAAFYGLDHNGYCFVAVQTQKNISRLWRDVIGNRQIAGAGEPSTALRANTPGPLPPVGSDGDPISNSTSGRELEIGGQLGGGPAAGEHRDAPSLISMG